MIEKLACGFCNKEFPGDVSVSVVIEHLMKKHHKRTIVEFCFLNAFQRVYRDE
jgi:hypothetical protein